MFDTAQSPLPWLQDGVVVPRAAPDFTVEDASGAPLSLTYIGQTGRVLLQPRPQRDLQLVWAGAPPLPIQVGGWAGRVIEQRGGQVVGWARNLRHPAQDVAVIAVMDDRIVAVARAAADADGRFLLHLPPRVTGALQPCAVTLGIAGSDYTLEGGALSFRPKGRAAPAELSAIPRPLQQLAIRIKIATPNLKEAPLWGDYHFAMSLAAAFERVGHQANVDTADQWYAAPTHEDVVLTIRGRHRVKIDRSKINLMWIISHPDRVKPAEYDDYDHVFVASDSHAAALRAEGHTHVSVLHQATDAALFGQSFEISRRPECLFVGNSRREYRTMVKWCIQQDLPLALYGGGWDGVLPPEKLRAASVANADLPALYAGHQLLLNDHWDSMRENGFLSNRLFDGSAVGTPILTDPVAGLADIFGDAIGTASDPDDFAQQVVDCLDNPAPWLERAARARQIVLAGHSFDHRAATLAHHIARLA